MIQNPFANLPPVTKNLLIINIICFIPFVIFPERIQEQLYLYLSGHYFASPLFKAWQPVTYMFLHGGFTHLLFNMFALFSFGGMVEHTIGSKRFFNYYFLCGLGAIALQLAIQAIEVHGVTGSVIVPGVTSENFAVRSSESPFLNYADPVKLYGIYNGSIVGASGAIFGVLIAFGMLFPNMEMMMLFIPVPIKAKYLIPAYIVIELFLGLKPIAGDSVAHFAHLGGALIGFIVIKIWGYRRRNNIF